MKVVKAYSALTVLFFIIGVAASLFFPPSVSAGPDPCSSTCYIVVVCEIGSCTSCPTHPCRPTVLYRGWANDPECGGPFDCGSSIIGCTACQA